MGAGLSRLCCGKPDLEEHEVPARLSDLGSQSSAFEAVLHHSQGQGDHGVVHPENSSIQPGLEQQASALGTSKPSGDDLAQPNVRRLAGHVYREGRLYHGTSQAGAEFMRQSGMDVHNKTGSLVRNATEAGLIEATQEQASDFIKTSNEHNYFTTEKQSSRYLNSAKDYAERAATSNDPPHILRIMTAKMGHGLETDPDSECGDPGYRNSSLRTRENIPSGNVLRSKSETPSVTEASEALRERFNTSNGRRPLRVDTILNAEQAASLLHEQQTPSPMDFPEVRPWNS